MSNDRAALLEGLRQNPNDLTLLRVYADWLDDHHHEARAEYLRLWANYCEMPQDNEAISEAVARFLACVGNDEIASWCAGFPQRVCELYPQPLLSSVELTAEEFLYTGSLLMEREPVVELKILSLDSFAALTECPALAYIRRLDISELALGDDGLKRLAASRYLGNLQELRLVNSGINTAGMIALANSTAMPRLRVLNLNFYNSNQDPCENTLWRNVGLIVGRKGPSNTIGDEGLYAFTQTPHFPELAELLLAGNHIGVAGARSLARCGYLKNLHRLELSYNNLQSDDLSALAKSPLMRRIRILELQANEVGPDGAAALVNSPNAAQLELLELSASLFGQGPLIGDEGAIAIAQSPYLGSLRHLLLCGNEITERGGAALADSDGLPSLRTLLLANNNVSNRGARAFANSTLLRQLEKLDLGANHIDDAGARAILRSKTFGEKLVLSLSNHEFSDDVRESLIERFGEQIEVTMPATEEETEQVPQEE
jgi:uncharacterized protein (TIGR02996 family)